MQFVVVGEFIGGRTPAVPIATRKSRIRIQVLRAPLLKISKCVHHQRLFIRYLILEVSLIDLKFVVRAVLVGHQAGGELHALVLFIQQRVRILQQLLVHEQLVVERDVVAVERCVGLKMAVSGVLGQLHPLAKIVCLLPPLLLSDLLLLLVDHELFELYLFVRLEHFFSELNVYVFELVVLDIVFQLMTLLGLVGDAVGASFVRLVVAVRPGLPHPFRAVLLVSLARQILLPGLLRRFVLLRLIGFFVEQVIRTVEVFSHQIRLLADQQRIILRLRFANLHRAEVLLSQRHFLVHIEQVLSAPDLDLLLDI